MIFQRRLSVPQPTTRRAKVARRVWNSATSSPPTEPRIGGRGGGRGGGSGGGSGGWRPGDDARGMTPGGRGIQRHHHDTSSVLNRTGIRNISAQTIEPSWLSFQQRDDNIDNNSVKPNQITRGDIPRVFNSMNTRIPANLNGCECAANDRYVFALSQIMESD